MVTANLFQNYYAHFPSALHPLIVRSPGRINFIGEHTDYNNGFVLPAAIDKEVRIAISAREDNEIHLFALDLEETFMITLQDLKPVTEVNWPNYILGVVAQFLKKGLFIKGFNAILTSDVPMGAGLSSSAAIECSTAFALNELFACGQDKISLVKMAQLAEHEFAGVRCGIMDQFASMFGEQDKVIRLDCRSLDYTYFPLPMQGLSVVLFDTNVKHSLASSAYNLRREQCEAGVDLIHNSFPDVQSLRDADMRMLDACVSKSDIVYNRCKYVIEEQQRLLQGCEDLANHNLAAFGKKMFATHEGLKNEYEVSCKDLDFLVNEVKNQDAVLGARMMGGGFGGCTINLVKNEAVAPLIEKISPAYYDAMHQELKAYVVSLRGGTSRITDKI